MTNNDRNKKDSGRFPPDLAALIIPFFTAPFLFVACGLSCAAKFGDKSLFDFAVSLGMVGVVLLSMAKIPLFRERRFFTVGPATLKGLHRKLYFAAYGFIVPSLLLLVLLCTALR